MLDDTGGLKLWRVENGYMGNGDVYVLVVAESEARALDLASEAFKRAADTGEANTMREDPDYWERDELRAWLIVGDLTREWASGPKD